MVITLKRLRYQPGIVANPVRWSAVQRGKMGMFCVLVCAFWTLQSRSAREIDYLRYQMSTMTSKIKCLNTWLKVVYPTHSTCLPINNLYPHSIKHPKLRLIPSKLGERKTNLALLPRWKIDRPTPQRSSCLGVVIYQSNCVFVGWLDK